MSVNFHVRFGGLSLGKFCRSLLLPLLLLVAQHGALLHELSHYISPQTQDQDEGDKQTSGKHPCELCLAFAQVASTATASVPVLGLLTGLSFAPSSGVMPATRTAEVPSQRNRGPPTFL